MYKYNCDGVQHNAGTYKVLGAEDCKTRRGILALDIDNEDHVIYSVQMEFLRE